MNPLLRLQDRWSRIEPLLDEALALPVGEREAWLQALPDLDAELRQTLGSLILADRRARQTEFLAELPRLPGAPPPADPGAAGQPAAGTTVGPYRLLEAIGRGGMAAVWLAERVDGQMRRRVALKLPHLSWDASLSRRLVHERDILATLEHPRIARLYDAGTDDQGRPWLALEFVQGEPIDAHAHRLRLSLRDRVRLLLQVCEAVAYAHGRLVIHRDLKPSNILVDADGQVRLLDFGVARLLQPDATDGAAVTATGTAALTPDYASPEQIRRQPLGVASDIYSLGVVAYELLAGVRPYRLSRGTLAEIEEAVLLAEVAPASSRCDDAEDRRLLRGDLDAVLAHALDKAADGRYASVEWLAADLRRWLQGQPVRARSISRLQRGWRLVQRHALASSLIAAATLGLVAATAVSLQQARTADRAAAQARNEARRALAVQELLLDIFRVNSVHQKEPLQAQQTTARQLLDLAAERVEVALADAPESQIAVLATLSDLYTQLGLPTQAYPLMRRRVDIARKVLRDDDPRRAAALLSLAGRLHDGGGRPEGRELLEEAGEVLARAGPAGDAQRGNWHHQRARFARYDDLGAALREAAAAQSYFRRHEPKARMRLGSLYILATLQGLAGDPAAAVQSLQESQRVAAELHPGDSAAALSGLSDAGEYLRRIGRYDEADRATATALELARKVYGHDNRMTLVMQIQRAQHLFEVGQAGPARELLDRTRDLIDARQPRFEGWWRTYADYLMARSLADRGRPDLQEPVQRRGVEAIASDLPQSGAYANRQRLLGEVLVMMGRLDDAEPWIERGHALWQRFAVNVEGPRRDQAFLLARAELALARGQHAHATHLLQAIAVPDPDRDGIAAATRRAVLSARAAWMRADADAAAAAARQALQVLARLPSGVHDVPLESRARIALAGAQALAGAWPAAQAELNRALALRLAYDEPGSLWVAQLRLLLAQCLQAQQQTAQAEALRREALRHLPPALQTALHRTALLPDVVAPGPAVRTTMAPPAPR